jgi:hypothetical protein
MGLEIIYFIGAFVLLIALVFATLSYHYRNRANDLLAEEVTRKRYLDEEENAAPLQPSVAPRLREPNGVEPPLTEDDIQRAAFGPRGVKDAPDPAVMTPQRAKKTPKYIDPGHVS